MNPFETPQRVCNGKDGPFGILIRMTPDMILLIAGCILLLIGLLGGGITSQYMTIGKVDGKTARALCVLIGFGLIGVGVWLKIWPQLPHREPAIVKQEPNVEPKVESKLAPILVQKPEQKVDVSSRTVPPHVSNHPTVKNVKIYLVGDFMEDKYGFADVVIDQTIKVIVTNSNTTQNPVEVIVPKSGPHQYTIHGEDAADVNSVTRTRYILNATGEIDVAEGRIFAVQSQKKLPLRLVERGHR